MCVNPMHTHTQRVNVYPFESTLAGQPCSRLTVNDTHARLMGSLPRRSLDSLRGFELAFRCLQLLFCL